MRIKTFFLVLGLAFATSAKAQLSVAADMAWPTGDFGDSFSFGVGPGLGYDLGIGSGTLVIFGQASYQFLTPSGDVEASNAFMVPYQAGLKFNFGGDPQGLYAFGMVGGHSLGYKFEVLGSEESYSVNLFSWGAGGGFRTNGKLDFAVRYNSISADNDFEDATNSDYIGLRVGLVLGGKD